MCSLIGGTFSCPATNRCQPKPGRRNVYRVVVGKKAGKPFSGLKGIFYVEVVVGGYARDYTRRKATAYFFKEGHQMAQELRGFVSSNRFSCDWPSWGISVFFDLGKTQLGQVNSQGVFSTTIDWTRAELAEFAKKREAEARKQRGEVLKAYVKAAKNEKAVPVGMYPQPVQMLPEARQYPVGVPVQSAMYPQQEETVLQVVSNELDLFTQGLKHSWNGLMNEASAFFAGLKV